MSNIVVITAMQSHYLTENLPGIGGQLKSTPTDFQVTELPRYLPSGEGQHLYLFVEKEGISTSQVTAQLAKFFGVPSRAVGYAGMKDVRAVTRQWVSLDGGKIERVEAFVNDRITILEAAYHRNKLKIGHLSGNRFTIRVREVEEVALPTAEQVLSQLAQAGVPNFFGEQRFGSRENNHLLGEAIVRQQSDRFVSAYLGQPSPDETPPVQAPTGRRGALG